MTRPSSRKRGSVRRNSGDIPPNAAKAEKFAQMLTELMEGVSAWRDRPYYYVVVPKRKYLLVDKVQDLGDPPTPSHVGDFIIGPGGPGEENGIVYRTKAYGVPNLRSRVGSLDKCLSSEWVLEHGLFPAMRTLRRNSRNLRPNAPEILSSREVEQLPVGSIVYPWQGRPDGSPLVVLPGGYLTQTALLPERADGEEPGGDLVAAWGIKSFALVAKGKGRLMTLGTAYRLTGDWFRTIGWRG